MAQLMVMNLELLQTEQRSPIQSPYTFCLIHTVDVRIMISHALNKLYDSELTNNS